MNKNLVNAKIYTSSFDGNMKNNITALRNISKQRTNKIEWNQIPATFKNELKKAAETVGLKNVNSQTYFLEFHEKKKLNSTAGFNIHKNNMGFNGHLMTLLYYFDIEQINTELRFFSIIKPKTTFDKLKSFFGILKFDMFAKKEIKQGDIIAFGDKYHQPYVKITGDKPKRYVLSIFVTK
jgi:hypothetical protein